MNQNNPYRAYWEKAQEQSLKLAQYYTPECLVELCIFKTLKYDLLGRQN